MKTPERLYHAAPECVLASIATNGLRSNWGEIYAAESPAHALTFMWFRLLDHVHPQTDNGTPYVNIERHDAVHVWEIDTSKTDLTKWDHGTDHNAKFFGDATSWVYTGGVIPPDAIECYVYSRQDIENAASAAK